MSLDKVNVDYTANVDDAIKDLDALKAKNKELDKEAKKAGDSQKKAGEQTAKYYKAIGDQVKRLAGYMAAAFSVGAIISYGREAVELAKKLVTVEKAFNRLNDPQLLGRMRTATKGTLSDLELMTQVNFADSFKIPLDQLDGLAEFAVLKAAETGQSVEFMMNSVVTGIARGSIMILDNLGISSRELNEELNGVGARTADIGMLTEAVTKIASRQIDAMRLSWDEAAGSIMQTEANIENLKANFGKALIPIQAAFLNFANQTLTQATYFGDAWVAAFGDISKASNEGILALARTNQEFREFENRFNAAFGKLTDETMDDFVAKLAETYGLTERMIAQFNGIKVGPNGEDWDRFKIDVTHEDYQNFKEYTKVLEAYIEEAQKLGTVTSYGAQTLEDFTTKAKYSAIELKKATESGILFTDLGRKMNSQFPATALTMDELREELKLLEGEFDKAKPGGHEYNNIIKRTAELTNEATRRSEAWAKVVSRIGIVSGSIADLTLRMSELQKQQEKATTPEQWKALDEQAQAYQKRIDSITGTSLKNMNELLKEMNDLIFGATASEDDKAIAEINARYDAVIEKAKVTFTDQAALATKLAELEKARITEVNNYKAEKQREAEAKELEAYYQTLETRKALGVASMDELYELEIKALGEAFAKGQIAYAEYYAKVNQIRGAMGQSGLLGEDVELDKSIDALTRQIAIMETMLKVTEDGSKQWYELKDAIKAAREELEMWGGEVPKAAAASEDTKKSFDYRDLARTSLFSVQNLFRTVLLERERLNGLELASEIEKNQALLDAGKVTEEQKAALDVKAKRDNAERSKKLAEYNSILAVAEAFLQGLLRGGPLVGAAYAALAFAEQQVIKGLAVPAFAEGIIGFQGKGTETSDSNLVAISNNESILKAKATRKHGPLLEAINSDNESALDAILTKYRIDRHIEGTATKTSDGGLNITVSGAGNEALAKEVRRANKEDIEMQALVGREIVKSLKSDKRKRTWK